MILVGPKLNQYMPCVYSCGQPKMYTVCLVLRRNGEGDPSIDFYESRQALVEELVEQILYLEGEDAGAGAGAGADAGADADADADESEDNAVQERRAELFASNHSELSYYYEQLMNARGIYGEDYYDIDFFTSATPIRMSETDIGSSTAASTSASTAACNDSAG